MKTDQRPTSSNKTVGVVCTVLGGALGLWVIARLGSAAGMQQTWAPPFARYEWVTRGGGGVASDRGAGAVDAVPGAVTVENVGRRAQASRPPASSALAASASNTSL